jgi:hypothetical protein
MWYELFGGQLHAECDRCVSLELFKCQDDSQWNWRQEKDDLDLFRSKLFPNLSLLRCLSRPCAYGQSDEDPPGEKPQAKGLGWRRPPLCSLVPWPTHSFLTDADSLKQDIWCGWPKNNRQLAWDFLVSDLVPKVQTRRPLRPHNWMVRVPELRRVSCKLLSVLMQVLPVRLI